MYKDIFSGRFYFEEIRRARLNGVPKLFVSPILTFITIVVSYNLKATHIQLTELHCFHFLNFLKQVQETGSYRDHSKSHELP